MKKVSILGIPYDANSSFMRGAAEGPYEIRKQLHSGAANWSTETGTDLSAGDLWEDAGDLVFPSEGPEDAFGRIEQGVSRLLDKDLRLLSLGGDHSITYPLFSDEMLSD